MIEELPALVNGNEALVRRMGLRHPRHRGGLARLLERATPPRRHDLSALIREGSMRFEETSI